MCNYYPVSDSGITEDAFGIARPVTSQIFGFNGGSMSALDDECSLFILGGSFNVATFGLIILIITNGPSFLAAIFAFYNSIWALIVLSGRFLVFSRTKSTRSKVRIVLLRRSTSSTFPVTVLGFPVLYALALHDL